MTRIFTLVLALIWLACAPAHAQDIDKAIAACEAAEAALELKDLATAEAQYKIAEKNAPGTKRVNMLKAKIEAARKSEPKKKEEPSKSPPPDLPRNFTETVNGVSFTMIHVAGSTFQMGDTFGEGGSDELPVHPVTLDGYHLGQTEVTQALWRAVMGSDPSYFKNCAQCPVEQVSWEDCQEFIQKLNQQTNKRYRLPTEAEWEFAARERGKNNRFGNGQNILRPSEANFDASVDYKKDYSVAGEYRRKTVPVKTFAPNSVGLYEMSGNVWEWCADWYDENFYKTPAARERNPINKNRATYYVLRGGSWYD